MAEYVREETPLVGDDSQIFTGKKGTTYNGDGTKTLSQLVAGDEEEDPAAGAGMYLIAGIAASGSVFPAGMTIFCRFPHPVGRRATNRSVPRCRRLPGRVCHHRGLQA